jgi:hypothetical protein
MANRRDRYTPDLFEVPMPAEPLAGSMDYRLLVSGLIAEMLKGHDRSDIAAACSKLTGKDVSSYMLDSYCAKSKEDFNAPAWLVPAIEVTTDSWGYSTWLASVRGGRLMIGRDALAAELGRIQREQDRLSQHARMLKDQLRKGA